MATLSHDGFLRMPLTHLRSLHLVHVVSAVDTVAPSDALPCGTATTIAGYTEWAGEGAMASLSLGWDWRLQWTSARAVVCVRLGAPRSNIMLVDARVRDYGWERNLAALAEVVDMLEWSEQTRRALDING